MNENFEDEEGTLNQTNHPDETAGDNIDSGNSRQPTKQDSLRIEIIKYQPLINAISDSRNIARTAGLIALIVYLVFCGLLLLTITLKRVYPYSDIQTNMYGATTIRDEKKDVMYWLFNPAELWANSGISVKKGDVLNIRASGMSHTAIHSLVRDASDNRVLGNKWISSDGIENRENPRDVLRSQWRIIPERPQDALVMRVIGDDDLINKSYSSESDDRFIYLVGKGREGLQIHKDGYLQFAINDIVLTKDVIYKMLYDHARMLIDSYEPSYLPQFYRSHKPEYSEKEYHKLINDSVVAKYYALYNNNKENPISYQFGPAPAPDDNPDNAPNTWNCNEMTYYMDKQYINAWFDDNIGSFLIVIERKHE